MQHALIQLNTPHTESLTFLTEHFLAKKDLIEAWFQSQWEKTIAPVYGSVDLRNAGFKLAPIDMNLFPAGFNNLNPDHLESTVKSAYASINQLKPNVKNILIIPENHTRNLNYWSNIKTLQKILETAGFNVRFGSLNPEVTQPVEIELPSGDKIVIEELQRRENKISVMNFTPDMIILNNDLSDGIPDKLKNLDQIIQPPAELGWSQRFKSEHFHYYAHVTAEFSEAVQIDPWLVAPLFRYCGDINFMHQEGLNCLINNAEILFEEIEKKYKQYNIQYQPFLIVKADAGTYGMAVMTVRNVDELKNLNRKQRTRMSTIKGGQPVKRVIIQEGVYTFETVGQDNAVAEPVVYLFGKEVVGGFYRVHKDRGTDENLNAPGMQFEPIAFSQSCNAPETQCSNARKHFYLYGIIAQLSMLAAAREINELSKEGK